MKSSALTEIVPGVWRWHGPGGENSYVWVRGKETVLIDPARDLTAEELGKAGLAQPGACLVTHVQAEHVDGAANFSGVPIYVAEEDVWLGRGPAILPEIVTPWPPPWDWDERGGYRGHLAGAINERPSSRPLDGVVGITPGHSVAGLTAVPTPGQGKQALTWRGVLSDGRSVAFCGDLILAGGHLLNWYDCDWDYGMETGQKALLSSVRLLKSDLPDLLLPAHGDIIINSRTDLDLLEGRLTAVLDRGESPGSALNFPEVDSPMPGFRQILPNLHQCRASGNCAVLISEQSRHALLVDDGLCHWVDLEERARHHRETMRTMKKALNIRRFDWVIPTHYHGDHIENIPDLVREEGVRVLCLDGVADVLENPHRYNLACKLPWYGTRHNVVRVDEKVADGHRLRWEEYEIEIFHLGGQTYYHLGLSVQVDGLRVVFAGDSLSGMSAEIDAILTYNDCEPVHRGWYHALRQMERRKPDVIVAGHGVAAKDPVPLLNAKLARWEERLRQFVELSGSKDLRPFFDPFVHPNSVLVQPHSV